MSLQESDIIWTIENSKLWDWNLLVVLYSTHRRCLGLGSIMSLQESDIIWTIENSKLWN